MTVPLSSAEKRRLHNNLDRPLDDLMDELALYSPAARGPADAWQRIIDPLRQRICVEWAWCTVRQDARFENDYDLAIVLAGVLTDVLIPELAAIDITLICAILLKRGLDKFCNC